MNQVLQIVFQIAAFVLFQTILLHLVGKSKYEKYIRTFSGFLLILLLISAIRSFLKEGNLMEEVEKQVQFATEEGDFRLQLQQAEEYQQQELKEGYETRILEEAAWCLSEERYFLIEGEVTFSEEWKLEKISLTVSKTWENVGTDGTGETLESAELAGTAGNTGTTGSTGTMESEENDIIEEIWMEPVEPVEPVEEITLSKQNTAKEQTDRAEEGEKGEEGKEGKTEKERTALQNRLAKRLGVTQEQILLYFAGESSD